jgi:hypothetical protein
MSKTKWEAMDCWIHDIKSSDIPEDLKNYHPEHPRPTRSVDSYNMDLISTPVKDEYYIRVTTDGYNGTAWSDDTKKLLDKTALRVDPLNSDKLISDLNIDLLNVVGIRFGHWSYVTIAIDFKQKVGYREYTTTMVWSENDGSEDKASLSPTTTSYKWRD